MTTDMRIIQSFQGGKNFRMNEMQGAVGIAQLKKLGKIVKMQNKNLNLIWNQIKSIKEIKKREKPKNSTISADALIILMQSKKQALSLRKELLKENISTKILPEATKWHFAPNWEHIKELNFKYPKLKNEFRKSKKILERAVSIPIFVKMKKTMPKQVREAIERIL